MSRFRSHIFLLISTVCINSCLGFFNPAFDADPNPIFLKEHCAKNGVTFDEKTFDQAKLCALKVVNGNKISVSPNGKLGYLQAVCDFLPSGKQCYTEAFKTLHKCFPLIEQSPNIYQLDQFLENIENLLCVDDIQPKVLNLLTDIPVPLMTCAIKHYKAIGDQMMSCPVVVRALLNPDFLSEEGAICKSVDEVKKCLLNAGDLCENAAEKVKAYIDPLFDVLMSLMFKCKSGDEIVTSKDEL